MAIRFINVGFGSMVSANRIIAVVSSNSSPIKKIKEEARDNGKLIDVTHGRRTRSIIIMDSGHIILSALHSDTISGRINSNEPEEG
ncbi:MAG: DUF370 domain-containing protein [Synergistetes bacterium]|nr:DUF370 domain-containing protein [Synergistota bacterium]